MFRFGEPWCRDPARVRTEDAWPGRQDGGWGGGGSGRGGRGGEARIAGWADIQAAASEGGFILQPPLPGAISQVKGPRRQELGNWGPCGLSGF